MQQFPHYERYLRQLLLAVSEGHCRPCTKPQKETMRVDYENPLDGECRCADVESLLNIAEQIAEHLKLDRV